MKFPFLVLASLAVGCGGGSDDPEGGGSVDRPSASITSPSDGDTFTEGEEVELAVDASYESGDAAQIESATWTAGSWSSQGATGFTSDLPVGELTLEVEAVVDGKTLTDAISITVVADGGGEEGGGVEGGGAEGGGTEGGGEGGGGALVNFGGSMSATVTYESIELDCPGSVSFSIEAGALAGTGSCTVEFLDEDVYFELQGTDDRGTVSGDMLMDADGTIYATPFEGVRTTEDHVHAAFDATHSSSDGSIRIDGTFDADPI